MEKEFEKMKNQDHKLDLRFCLENEIFEKRKYFLQFKSVFLAKMEYMKLNGERNELLFKINEWLEDNIENLPIDSVKITKLAKKLNLFWSTSPDEYEKQVEKAI